MSKNDLKNIRGLFFDLDGTLYIGNEPIKGAVSCIEQLKKRNIPCRFLTNTTTKSHQSMFEKVNKLGLPIEKDEILFPTIAAINYLRKKGNPTCHFLLTDDPKSDFAEFEENSENPDYVLIGDFAKEDWNYEVMNHAFRLLINGAELLALHKGRYWQMPDGLQVDIGAFVAGLEHAISKQATLFGKPSTEFFNMALESIGLDASEVAMVGDDIINDIGGAQNFGMTGIQVKTGKYRPELVKLSDIKPDYIIESVADLNVLL